MSGLVTCWLFVGLSAPAAPVPTTPGVVVVLAEAPAYRSAKGPELAHDGVLERVPGAAPHTYRLLVQEIGGGRRARALHAPGKAHLLEPFAGKAVRVMGKLVEGKGGPELWPGRVEALAAAAGRPGAGGVFARCYWQPSSVMTFPIVGKIKPKGPRVMVIRDGAELARLMQVSGKSAGETATALMARRLGVTGIDWKKHMLVCVSAGLALDVDRLTVLKVAPQGKALLVSYQLPPARPGAGLGSPAETVLIQRFEGEVRLHREGGGSGPAKR